MHGRMDCTPDSSLSRPFFTSRKEVHPSINFNGPEVMKFYKDNFGLTADLSIALHGGAHSFGAFHDEVSMLKYQWTRNQEALLNNQQFVKISLRDEYYFMCRGSEPVAIGDENGQPAKTFWTVLNSKKMVNGGPFQFFHNYLKCSRGSFHCSNVIAGVPNNGKGGRCCNDLPPGKVCLVEDPALENCMQHNDNDQEANILTDAALYWKFQVEPQSGAPYGCSNMNDGRWRKGKVFQKRNPNCDREDHAPEGRPMFEIVEDYADNQDNWVAAFYTAIEKMLSNGYNFGP